ncbi:hypothetical protein KKA09_00395 [Patescibacteria group bacterium]|nr:hypothetical protein [Patescibacteria group bacterium]
MIYKNFFKKIQGLNRFHKKLIVFGIIAAMAVLLGIFIIANFQKNLKKMESAQLLKETIIKQAIKEKKNEVGEELNEKLNELKKMGEEIEKEMGTTSAESEL